MAAEVAAEVAADVAAEEAVGLAAVGEAAEMLLLPSLPPSKPPHVAAAEDLLGREGPTGLYLASTS